MIKYLSPIFLFSFCFHAKSLYLEKGQDKNYLEGLDKAAVEQFFSQYAVQAPNTLMGQDLLLLLGHSPRDFSKPLNCPLTIDSLRSLAKSINHHKHRDVLTRWSNDLNLSLQTPWTDMDERAWVALMFLDAQDNLDGLRPKIFNVLDNHPTQMINSRPIFTSILLALENDIVNPETQNNYALDYVKRLIQAQPGQIGGIFEGISIGSLFRHAGKIEQNHESILTLFKSMHGAIQQQNCNFCFGFALNFLDDNALEDDALKIMGEAFLAPYGNYVHLIESWMDFRLPSKKKHTELLREVLTKPFVNHAAMNAFLLAVQQNRFDSLITPGDREIIINNFVTFFARAENFHQESMLAYSFNEFLKVYPEALKGTFLRVQKDPASKYILVKILSNNDIYSNLTVEQQKELIEAFVKSFDPDEKVQLDNNAPFFQSTAYSVAMENITMSYCYHSVHASFQARPSKQDLFFQVINEMDVQVNSVEGARWFAWFLHSNQTNLIEHQKSISSKIRSLIAANEHYLVARMSLSIINMLPVSPPMQPMHGMPPGPYFHDHQKNTFTEPCGQLRKQLSMSFSSAFNKLTVMQKREILKMALAQSFHSPSSSLNDFLKNNLHYTFFDFSKVTQDHHQEHEKGFERAYRLGCSPLQTAVCARIDDLRNRFQPNLRNQFRPNGEKIFIPHGRIDIENAAKNLLEICRLSNIDFNEFIREGLSDPAIKEQWQIRIKDSFGNLEILLGLTGVSSERNEWDEASHLKGEQIETAVQHFNTTISNNFDSLAQEIMSSTVLSNRNLSFTTLHILAILIKYIDQLDSETQKQSSYMAIVEVMASPAGSSCNDGFLSQLINTFHLSISNEEAPKTHLFGDVAGRMISDSKAIFDHLLNCLDAYQSDCFSSEHFQDTSALRNQLSAKDIPQLEATLRLFDEHAEDVMKLFNADPELLRKNLEKELDQEVVYVSESAMNDAFKNVIFYPALLSQWTDSFSNLISFDLKANIQEKLVVPQAIDSIMDTL